MIKVKMGLIDIRADHIHLNLLKMGSVLLTTFPSSNTNRSLSLSYRGTFMALFFLNYFVASLKNLLYLLFNVLLAFVEYGIKKSLIFNFYILFEGINYSMSNILVPEDKSNIDSILLPFRILGMTFCIN